MGFTISDGPQNKKGKFTISDYDFSAMGPEGEELKKDMVNRDFQPSTEISTITGEPVMKANLNYNPRPASLKTNVKQGFVDDPGTKIKIYADDRFPDLPPAERYSRYGVIDGEIVYVGDDGKMYSEVNDGVMGSLKRGVGEFVANAPGMVLSAAGAASGTAAGPFAVLTSPVLAGVGAAGGEGYRKAVGNLVFDEPQTSAGNAVDMAVQGAIGTSGELAGRAINVGRKAVKLKGQNPVKYAVGASERFTPAQHAAAQEAVDTASKFGMELLPHQAYQDPRMTNIWKYLRNHPNTSGAVSEIEDHLASQNSKGFNDLIDTNRDPAMDIWEVGQNLSDASRKAVDVAEQARTQAVQPMYNELRKKTGLHVDTKDLLDEMDTVIDMSKGSSLSVMKKVKNMLIRNGSEEADPETRFMALDEVKKEIDHLLDGPESSSIEKTTKFRLGQIKDKLVSEMDKVAPVYKDARKLYADMSPEVESIKKGVVGRIGTLEGEKVIKSLDMLFSNDITAPVAARAKRLIMAQDPKAWKDAYFTFLKKSFDNFSDPSTNGEIKSAGSKMFKKFAFGENKQDVLKAIADTPEQYKTFQGFFDTMRRTGIGSGKESATWIFKNTEEELVNNAGSKILKFAETPLKKAKEIVFNQWNDIILNGNQDLLLNALKEKSAVRNIAQIKKLSPENLKFWNKLSTVLTVGGGVLAKNKVQRMGIQDLLPESVRPFVEED